MTEGEGIGQSTWMQDPLTQNSVRWPEGRGAGHWVEGGESWEMGTSVFVSTIKILRLKCGAHVQRNTIQTREEEIPTQATMWMNLGDMVLSDVSHSWKDRYRVIPPPGGLQRARSYTVRGVINWCSHYGKQYEDSSKN